MTPSARRLTFEEIIERGLSHRAKCNVPMLRADRAAQCPKCGYKAPFSAFATNSGRDGVTSVADAQRNRITRIVWLIARFLSGERVYAEEYFARFAGGEKTKGGGNSYRSLMRDLGFIREAGFILEAHHPRDGGGWTMVTFRSEAEAA